MQFIKNGTMIQTRLSVPQLPISTAGATTSLTSTIDVIESQLIGKQLPDVIAVGVSGYSRYQFVEASSILEDSVQMPTIEYKPTKH